MKKRIKKIMYNFIKNEGITAIIILIIILFVFIKNNIIDKAEVSLIDWTMLTSIVIALIINNFSKIIKAILMNKLEDSVKLTCDYTELIATYKNNMISYDNKSASQKNLRKLKKSNLKIYIPVICEFIFENCRIDIKDSKSKYKLPNEVDKHFDEIFKVHSTSKIYNQLLIRVDDWKYEDKKFVIKTSRTTFFDSLVTNRAMDFCWNNGLTVRNRYECGPYIHPLNESCLSNHLGFNGFIESSDGYIIFVKRGNKLSIGKGMYGCSVSAILNGINCSGDFTKEELIKGILCTIDEELKLSKNELEKFSIDKHIIAAYRDIVEGGKPQLLFYMKSYLKKKQIEENFFDKIKKNENSKKEKLLEDGRNLLFIAKSELNQLCILPDKIIHYGKSYHMMPSVTASIVMLIKYLKKRG